MPAPRTQNRREFLQLAHTYDPKKHRLNGWFISEKLDGMRAFWDGGITRGRPTFEIPFANTDKDKRYLNPPIATGLWSRYGKAIQAPLWFLDALPPYPLDGELYSGPGNFQRLRSAVSKLLPIDEEWHPVRYKVFSLPDFSQVFRDGNINVPNFVKEIKGVIEWLHMQKVCSWRAERDAKARRFEAVQFLLEREHPHDNNDNIVSACEQIQLPFTTFEAELEVDIKLGEVVHQGGEGLVAVAPNCIWTPQRSHECLKIKPENDCEVKVIGYTWGRETNKGSKLLGKMGALITEFQGKRLEISGFTDAEREMSLHPAIGEAEYSIEPNVLAGKEATGAWHNSKFPIGSIITIKYRELTDDGLPKEARYWRDKSPDM